MELDGLQDLLRDQEGVIARRQVLAAGLDDAFIERMLRRREWARVHPGVYVNHTGELSWPQRAWAGVLWAWPAALSGSSALGPEPPDRPVYVAVDHRRRVRRVEGVRVRRVVGFAGRVLWNASPPRLRLEEAVIDLSAAADDLASVVALIADVCRARRTTPRRLLWVARRRPRLRHRRWILAALDDVGAGVGSVLEHGYLRKVERAHGLPLSARQRTGRTEDGVVYRDVTYEKYRLVVELDGRLGHEWTRDRWDDMDRDLLAATERLLTLRLGWRHVEQTPCRTAARLGRVLALRGWPGSAHKCGPGCAIRADRGSSPAPGAEELPG